MGSPDPAAEFSSYEDMMDDKFIPTSGCRLLLGVDEDGHPAMVFTIDGKPSEIELLGAWKMVEAVLTRLANNELRPGPSPGNWT